MKNKKVIRIVSELLDKLEELASVSSYIEVEQAYGYCKKLVKDAFSKQICDGWEIYFPGEIISIPITPLVKLGDYVKRDGNDTLVKCIYGDPECFGKVVSICTGLGHAVASVLLLRPVYME